MAFNAERPYDGRLLSDIDTVIGSIATIQCAPGADLRSTIERGDTLGREPGDPHFAKGKPGLL